MEQLNSVANLKSMEQSFDVEAWKQEMVDKRNDMDGTLTGFDCAVCKNKGVVYYLQNGEEFQKQCECMVHRKTAKNIEQSGLKDLVGNCTMDNFKSDTAFQRMLKQRAGEFLDQPNTGAWFYIGGQVGSGKTHICVAIMKELMNRGIEGQYMKWAEHSNFLKSKKMNERYQNYFSAFADAPVLYIDDLFKTRNKNMAGITEADLDLAFEIINHRYITGRYITIISSEWLSSELLQIDEAVGSRIIQKAGSFVLNVQKDKTKNYRLGGAS